jgi:hypothetical protein
MKGAPVELAGWKHNSSRAAQRKRAVVTEANPNILMLNLARGSLR